VGAGPVWVTPHDENGGDGSGPGRALAGYLALVWPVVATSDATATALLAGAEEGSRRASEAVLLGAGTASLIAVAFTLAEARATIRHALLAYLFGAVILAVAVSTVAALLGT
jgi:uncharacterized membrane protein